MPLSRLHSKPGVTARSGAAAGDFCPTEALLLFCSLQVDVENSRASRAHGFWVTWQLPIRGRVQVYCRTRFVLLE